MDSGNIACAIQICLGLKLSAMTPNFPRNKVNAPEPGNNDDDDVICFLCKGENTTFILVYESSFIQQITQIRIEI